MGVIGFKGAKRSLRIEKVDGVLREFYEKFHNNLHINRPMRRQTRT